MVRRACVLLRTSVSYRAESFASGLARHGFSLEDKWLKRPEPGDLLVMWNRTRGMEAIAQIYERAGATLLIAENGYLGSDDNGHKLFSLARNHHNGAGQWHVGAQPRRTFDLKPWREKGDHILILPQRGIGEHGVAMPQSWPIAIKRRLAEITDRPIRVRAHPGANRTDPWPDLKGAHCAVTWASGAALKAICHGIPVFHGLKNWIGAPAARYDFDNIEDCFLGERDAMLHRLSWAQWSIREIQSGEAFERII